MSVSCEDYRAAATIDPSTTRPDMDKKIACPMLALGARGRPPIDAFVGTAGHIVANSIQDAHEIAHANDIRRRSENRNITTWQIVVFGLTGGIIVSRCNHRPADVPSTQGVHARPRRFDFTNL